MYAMDRNNKVFSIPVPAHIEDLYKQHNNIQFDVRKYSDVVLANWYKDGVVDYGMFSEGYSWYDTENIKQASYILPRKIFNLVCGPQREDIDDCKIVGVNRDIYKEHPELSIPSSEYTIFCMSTWNNHEIVVIPVPEIVLHFRRVCFTACENAAYIVAEWKNEFDVPVYIYKDKNGNNMWYDGDCNKEAIKASIWDRELYDCTLDIIHTIHQNCLE